MGSVELVIHKKTHTHYALKKACSSLGIACTCDEDCEVRLAASKARLLRLSLMWNPLSMHSIFVVAKEDGEVPARCLSEVPKAWKTLEAHMVSDFEWSTFHENSNRGRCSSSRSYFETCLEWPITERKKDMWCASQLQRELLFNKWAIPTSLQRNSRSDLRPSIQSDS
eukprot:2800114-Amphidinium_carterae.1